MIRNFCFVFLTVISLQQLCPAQSHFEFFEPVRPPREHQIMLHRGMQQLAPENSREAVLACARDFVEWVEVDVRQTKDGRHVIIHDATVDRTSNGTGRVDAWTLAEMKLLDFGEWFAPRFRGLQIQTLTELLELAKGKVNLCLDCKDVDPEILVAEVLAAEMQDQVVVYGDLGLLAEVHKFCGNTIARMTKYRPQRMSFEEFANEVEPAAVEIDADLVTRELCQEIHARGIKVQAKILGPDWDQPRVWREMFAAGVDWLQTDDAAGVRFTDVRSRLSDFPVQIAFHRGASRYAPENSLAAIRHAVAMGADYIEIDIRTTSDAALVLMHDRTVDRTSSGSGAINDLSAKALADLDVGSWFGKPYRDQRVPSLAEGLAAFGETANAYLDAKDITPERLLQAIQEHDLMQRHVVYQSLDYCKRLQELDPAVRTLPPLRGTSDLDKTLESKPYGVDAAWKALSANMIEQCHAAGVRVFSDALGEHENLEDYRQAISWGIDVIQTDFPLRVLRIIELNASKSVAKSN